MTTSKMNAARQPAETPGRTGSQFIPSPSDLSHSRVTSRLQRLKFIIRHRGEGHDPLLAKCFGVVPCRDGGLVKNALGCPADRNAKRPVVVGRDLRNPGIARAKVAT
jgi:hypothetical protein